MTSAILLSILVAVLFLAPAALLLWRWRPKVQVVRLNPYAKDGEYKKVLLSIIMRTRHEITFVRGDSHPAVFDQEVANALRACRGKRVRITFVCGPLTVSSRADKAEHPILELGKEGILQLYYADVPRPVHFVVADSTVIMWEAPHRFGAREREVRILENSHFVAARYRKLVLDDIRDGRLRAATVKDYSWVPGPEEAKVDAVMGKVAVAGLNPDKMSGADWTKFAADYPGNMLVADHAK